LGNAHKLKARMPDRFGPNSATITGKGRATHEGDGMRVGTTLHSAAIVLAFASSLGAASAVHAADQSIAGAGNADAAAVAGASPLVRSAMRRLELALDTIHDRTLRERTIDALFNTKSCVYHRSELTALKQQAIVDTLQREGLIAPADAAAFPGGARIGVFPPVQAGEGPCPQLPQGSTPSWRSHPATVMASVCESDTASTARTCSPSSTIPSCRQTTTGPNANCGPPLPTAR